VVFHHQEDGTTHMHMAWSRIDLETMRAIDPGLYKNKLVEVSRQLEGELGLTPVSSERNPEHQTLSAGRDEFEQSRRLGTDLREIRETIRDCWDRSDNGQSFSAALESEGLILARGDRRDFVVVDHEGGDHALGKRITGAAAAETRARLADIDRAALPSVENAKYQQLETAMQRPQPDELSPAHEPALDAMAAGAARNEGPAIGITAGQVNEAADAGLKVVDRATGMAAKLTDVVADLASDLLAGPAPRTITPLEYATDQEARQEYQAQQAAARASDEALDRMRLDMEAGRDIAPEDVRSLSRDHLLAVHDKGDEHLRQLIAEREKEQARTLDDGRERERDR
jgi:hypothetical protein